MKTKVFFSLLAMIFISGAYAQDDASPNSEKQTFDVGADLVSSYVWRAIQVDASPNIQGWGEAYFGKFTAGLWASTNFTGTYAEVDFYASFTQNNFCATFTDYFSGREHLYEFSKGNSLHVGELILAYTINESFPLQLSAGTILYGDDMEMGYYDENAEITSDFQHNYSTYIELQYPLSLTAVDLTFTLGGVTHESYFYNTGGPSIINLGIGISKSLPITDSFNLPISFEAQINPNEGNIYSVVKVSF